MYHVNNRKCKFLSYLLHNRSTKNKPHDKISTLTMENRRAKITSSIKDKGCVQADVESSNSLSIFLKVERLYSNHIFIDILRLFRSYLQWRTKINVMKGKCFVIPLYTWSWYLPHSALVVVYLNLVIQIGNLRFAK